MTIIIYASVEITNKIGARHRIDKEEIDGHKDRHAVSRTDRQE